MASRTSVVPWRYQKFSALLCSVVLEWILMLLMLLEGLLSYLVTTFAHLCKLQPPCPMCTRLDHVLGSAQRGFYRDLMCSSHKAEASSWAFRHIHQKLIDVHGMCVACLLSFATENKSNLEMYQSLMGKLGVGLNNVGYRNDFSMRYDASEAPAMKKDTVCSCCSTPMKLQSYPFVILQSKACGISFDDVCRVFSRFHQHINDTNYVAYSELRTSDSESEPGQHVSNAESLQKVVASDLKEGIILDQPQIYIAKGSSLYGNPQEKVPGNSELALAPNDGSHCKPSENTVEMCSIQTDGQQITEDSYKRDESENDVWYSAPGSITELSTAATTSVETDTMEAEKKFETTYMTSTESSFNNVCEDLQSLLSQLSNSSLQPDTDSPSVHDQREHAILNISRALSFRRNDSGISENTVNEVEVECTIDQLKRQIELDHQSISRLWKELEEERNASAVAANQTMAMITRLQEEKAAMQMEALQYQRMMEEQSEYDRKDLQNMTEMMQTLQAEIESYKVKLRDQFLIDEIQDHMCLSKSKEHEPATFSRVNVSLSCFEDEEVEIYISKRLKKLKQKLHKFSNNSKHVLPLSKVGDDDGEDSVSSKDGHEDDVVEQGENNDTVFDNNLRRHGSEADSKGKLHAMVSESDLAPFDGEISKVSRRLLALEADRSFLEHSVNSLRNGKEGEELIRDIACSLRELRKIGIAWKEYD